MGKYTTIKIDGVEALNIYKQYIELINYTEDDMLENPIIGIFFGY